MIFFVSIIVIRWKYQKCQKSQCRDLHGLILTPLAGDIEIESEILDTDCSLEGRQIVKLYKFIILLEHKTNDAHQSLFLAGNWYPYVLLFLAGKCGRVTLLRFVQTC